LQQIDESAGARDMVEPDSPNSILAIAQPDEEDTQSSPKAFENSSLVSTRQTLDPAAMTAEDEQRQRWKTLAVNAESFCVRFDNRKLTELIFEVCGNPWIKPKEVYYLFDKIAEQGFMETEFSVNLIHRRDIAILPDSWNEYTNLYEARLVGIYDESNSDDYPQYLAGLKEQDLRMDETPTEILSLLTRADTPREMPSLGVIEAKIHHLLWDDETMVFAVLLSTSWLGMDGVQYKVPSKAWQLAHLLIGTLNRGNPDRSEIGENLVKRFRADGPRGPVRILGFGIGASENSFGDVRPILFKEYISGDLGHSVSAEELTMSPSLPDTKPNQLPSKRCGPDCTLYRHVQDVVSSVKKVATTLTVSRIVNRRHSSTNDQVPSEPVTTTSKCVHMSFAISQPRQQPHTTFYHNQDHDHGTIRQRLFGCFCFQQ